MEERLNQVEDLLQWREGIEETLAQLGDETFELRSRMDKVRLSFGLASPAIFGTSWNSPGAADVARECRQPSILSTLQVKQDNSIAFSMLRKRDKSRAGSQPMEKPSKVAPEPATFSKAMTAPDPEKGGKPSQYFKNNAGGAEEDGPGAIEAQSSGGFMRRLRNRVRAARKRVNQSIPEDRRDLTVLISLFWQLAISAPLFWELAVSSGASIRAIAGLMAFTSLTSAVLGYVGMRRKSISLFTGMLGLQVRAASSSALRGPNWTWLTCPVLPRRGPPGLAPRHLGPVARPLDQRAGQEHQALHPVPGGVPVLLPAIKIRRKGHVSGPRRVCPSDFAGEGSCRGRSSLALSEQSWFSLYPAQVRRRLHLLLHPD